jgi:hypothetical protein
MFCVLLLTALPDPLGLHPVAVGPGAAPDQQCTSALLPTQ